MRALIIDPGKAPEICKLPDTGQELERWLGGPMQMQKFGHCFAALLYSRQAGAARPNRRYLDHWYYGRLLIVGCRNNRLGSLPKDLARQLAQQWANVEVQKT